MSWKFAGIIFKKDYGAACPELLGRLGVEYSRSTGGYTFAEAVSRANRATALGVVNGQTMLLDHLLPYDCAYELGKEGRLDELLRPLSVEGDDILNYIVDGVSGTYCFSCFSQGQRIRRWATEPGNVWCDEGKPVAGEAPLDEALAPIFAASTDEAHLLAVWAAFSGISFQELVHNDSPLFYFFM